MKKEKHTLTNPYNHHALSRYIDVYEVSTVDCAATQYSGYKGTEITLIDQTPAGYGFDHWNITGATLTGNNFILNNDVTAQASFSAIPYNITLQNDGHGTISASKTTGNINDIITLSNTANNNYYFSDYSITGATLTGNQFEIQTSDVTAKANFAQMSVSSLFVSSNAQLTANQNQTKSFEVTVNTANCNYITIKAYPNVTWKQSYDGVGWSVKELNWVWRPINHTGNAYTIRNNNFTKTTTPYYISDYIQYTNGAWIYAGNSFLNDVKLVYDIKNSRASAFFPNGGVAGTYLGYGPVTGLNDKLTFQVSVGNTTNIAYLSKFRVAGFRDFTAASAW